MSRRLPIVCINVAIVIVMLLHAARILPLPALDRLEDFLYDVRTAITLPKGIDNRIVIVDIDEDSLREEGHWPWSRKKLARLTDRLFDQYGVAALGYDVVFAERDVSQDLVHLRELAAARNRQEFVRTLDEFLPELDRDRLFASALSGRPVVLGYYFNINPERTQSSGRLPEPVDFPERAAKALFPPVASSYGANIDMLQQSAAGGGFFSNPLIGTDGVVRRVPTLHEYGGRLYASFALAVAQAYLGVGIEPAMAGASTAAGYPALEALYVGPFRVPVDANGGALVPWRGPSGSFPYVSAADVLNSRVADPELLNNAIALVGTTSLGLVDLRATPIQAAFPGVEIHANVLAGILDESFRHRPEWVWGAELFLLLGIGTMMIAVSPFLKPLRLWLFSLAILAALAGLNLYLWNGQRLALPLANSLFLLVTLYITDVMYGFFTEAREKRHVRTAFNHYLAPALVEKLAEDPKSLRLSGESREMTFLFSDIASFTSFSESIEPKTLVSVLNEYLDRMCQIVMAHGGTVDKIVGDAVHAIFNAPLDQPDHTVRAVECALEIDEFARQYAERKRLEGLEFGITRVGINTGRAVVGNFGGHSRFDYTAHGDAVNTAARLESVNKHFGTRICVAASTVAGCPEHCFRPIGSLVLKGKSIAIDTFELLTAEQLASERVRQYLEAFVLLRDGDPEAKQRFSDLRARYPKDPLIALHHERLQRGECSTTIVLAEK